MFKFLRDKSISNLSPKVLVVDPLVHSKLSKQYEHYNYLYDELCKVCNCLLYQKKNFSDISEILNYAKKRNFFPEVIYFGMGWFALDEEKFKKDLKNDGNIPLVGFLYKAQNYLKTKLDFLKKNNFNLIVTPLPACEEYKFQTGIECKLLAKAGDSKIFFDRKEKKIYDIGFSGALHDNHLYENGSFRTFNIRSRAQDLLNSEKGIKAFLNGSDDIKKRIPSYKEYAKKISQSQIWIATPGPHEEIVERHYEIGMSKTLLFCSEIHPIYKNIFVDGHNCIIFKNDLSDFLERFYFCMENKELIENIIQNAYKEFTNDHSYKSRAFQLKQFFKELI